MKTKKKKFDPSKVTLASWEETARRLLAQGLIEIAEYTSDGMPRYRITPSQMEEAKAVVDLCDFRDAGGKLS